MPKIDVHTHFLPEPYVDAMTRHGINWTGGLALPPWTPERHLEFMDQWGIDVAVLSCLAEGGVYFGDRQEARELASEINEIGAGVVRTYPQRFGVFGAIPLPSVDDALAEIGRIYDDLGLDGAYVVSQVDGIYVGDSRWEPVYAELNRRHATVFLHPVEPQQAPDLPWQHWIAEYVFDTTRAFITLMYNGVLDRYPDINWILSHGGGAVPYLSYRIGLAARVLAEVRSRVRRPVSEYLRSIYCDLAIADSPVQLNAMIDTVGTDNLLFGTDWPYTKRLFDEAQPAEHEPTSLLGPFLGERIAGTNALRILPGVVERLREHVA